MMKIKNFKVLSFAAMMNAMLLTGCHVPADAYASHNYEPYNPTRYYLESDENNNETVVIVGDLSYELVRDNIKIITFATGDVEFTRLVFEREEWSNDEPKGAVFRLYDLETGTCIVTYEKGKYDVGASRDNIDVVDINSFLPYIMDDENIKTRYEVQELVDIYNEKVVNAEAKTK